MSSSFNFPHPTTKADDLEDLYKAYGVDRSVVLDLAVLEILAELGLSLTQILPNFLRYVIAFLVKAREEGLSFGLSEFRQPVLVKRNKQNPGTFFVCLRPGRHVIEDIPYRDEKWREQFLVFNMDRPSMGEFDFSWLPRRWAENIDSASSGSSSMSYEIRGLIGILRRDRSYWSTFDQARIRAVFAMPEGDDSAPFVGDSASSGSSSMSYEIRGLIGILRRDRSYWSTFDQARIRAVFAMPEGDDSAPFVGGSEDEAEHSQKVIAVETL
ncbi:hypothetical protein F2Q69_00042990 [Brassica cretica]|uniref:Uncharacterized protein n=1 Tax=Brassica cretica TaxID=69181 RepID=A0A8S9NG36_BRACR|nr:hypothetical protein F2Q69_00042990 [Brassica cretica]